MRAIVYEILQLHVIGRPQLVGTTSIEHSELLSLRLHADLLRRLAMVTLIREAYFKKNNIGVPERRIPELDFLNAPLQDFIPDQMRKFASGLGMSSINPENEENLRLMLSYLELDESHIERLKNALTGGIPHQVLNALKHDQESQIIAGAGAFGAVTIATNMAGRGVDIKLGGEIQEEILTDVRKALNTGGKNPYGMTNAEMASALTDITEEAKEPYQESINTFNDFLDGMKRVRQVGGLHIIGSERHEARRIDNQLRGRSARQGDPGSSRFYLSLEDDLMRMFGGERAEAMMQLFNIDPAVPLESRMLGRLVEQAQERVEGYNFDIRKHLLEYDDVLNDQRERIYKERDRVLVKEDLEEDVLEMLQNEITRRVPEALADPEGPWKLLAFLEEMQPTIFYTQQNERILSFTLSHIVDLLEEETNGSNDLEGMRSAAQSVARQAIEAEQVHETAQISSFVQRTADSFSSQLDERLDLLDILLDNPDTYAGMSSREVSDLLQNQVRLKISLTSDTVRGLIEGLEDARQTVRDEVESQLASTFLSRMQMTIERRLNGRVRLDINSLLDKDWVFIENTVNEAIEKIYAERIESLNSPASQIAQNIDAIIKRQAEAGEFDLTELAAGLPQGTQAVIDARTHQRVNRRVNLISYVFLVGRMLENEPDEEITAEVLAHLQNVQQQLQVIWGQIELERLAQTEGLDNLLEWSYLENLSKTLDKEQMKSLSSKSLQEIINEDDEDFLRAFGRQVQNIIYRHILLRAISELWIEHLTQMEALRVSIGMEAYAQRDPLVQYKSQSTDRFRDLLSDIRLGVISQMFRLQPAQPRQPALEAAALPQRETPKETSNDGKKNRKRHKKH